MVNMNKFIVLSRLAFYFFKRLFTLPERLGTSTREFTTAFCAISLCESISPFIWPSLPVVKIFHLIYLPEQSIAKSNCCLAADFKPSLQ